MDRTPRGDPEVPVPVRPHAYEAKVQTNSDSSRIAIVSQNADLIEIFDASGLLHVIRGPEFNEPVYTLHGNENGVSWLSLDNATIKSYVSVTATDDLVFALYSGQTMEDFKNSAWTLPPSRRIFVFTWSGDPVAVLRIADGLLGISISQDGLDLYAIYHRPVPAILHYDVPRLR